MKILSPLHPLRNQRLKQYIKHLPNLVAYYPLNETTGSIAFNHAPSTFGTLNGTITGATIGQAGKVGRAYSFDGINDYVNTNYAPNIALNDTFTICIFFRAELQTAAEKYLFGGIKEAGTNDPAITISAQIDGSIRFFIRDATGATISRTVIAYQNNVWQMVALSREASNLHRLISNGVSVETQSTSIQGLDFTGNNFYIGAMNNRGSLSSPIVNAYIQHVFVATPFIQLGKLLKLTQIAGLA